MVCSRADNTVATRAHETRTCSIRAWNKGKELVQGFLSQRQSSERPANAVGFDRPAHVESLVKRDEFGMDDGPVGRTQRQGAHPDTPAR